MVALPNPKAAPFLSSFRIFTKSRRGTVATLTALLAPIFIIAVGFAADEGAVYLEKRQAQGLADLAAVVAASNTANAEKLALETLDKNGFRTLIGGTSAEATPQSWLTPAPDDTGIKVEPGRYRPLATIDSDKRFTAGLTPYDAVRVTITKPANLYFMASFAPRPLIKVSGVAHVASEAAFSIGSRLAQLNGGLLNSVLGSLLGAQLNLSVMDYQALLDADVDALAFLDAMAIRTGVTAGTYSDVLKTRGTLSDVVAAMEQATPSTSRARSVLRLLGQNRALDSLGIDVSSLMSIGDLGSRPLGSGGVEMKVAAMQMLSAAAAIANSGHIVALDLGLNFPGLASLTAKLTIGEPPVGQSWFSYGEAGTTVHTAQTRLYLEAKVKPGGLLGLAEVRLPVYLELADARATITDVSCRYGDPKTAVVDIDALPGVADLWIADIDFSRFSDFSSYLATSDAKILQLPLLKVWAKSHAQIANMLPDRLTFTYDDLTSRRIKTVTTRDYTTSLVAGLLRDTDIKTSVGLGLSAPAALMPTILAGLTAPLDTALYNILATLGVGVGQADVRLNGVNCGRSVLVQ